MEEKEIKYISLSKAAEMTEYSQEYISLLCRTKKMKGLKLGRNWVTTSEWVRAYIDKTKGHGEFIIPVRIENKRKEIGKEKADKPEEGSKKTAFIAYKPHFLTFNEMTLLTVFFGIILAAFAFVQEMIILNILT